MSGLTRHRNVMHPPNNHILPLPIRLQSSPLPDDMDGEDNPGPHERFLGDAQTLRHPSVRPEGW